MSGSQGFGGGYGQQNTGLGTQPLMGQQPWQSGQAQMNGWQQQPLGAPGTGNGVVGSPAQSPGNVGPSDPGSYAPPPGYQQPAFGLQQPAQPMQQTQSPFAGNFFGGGNPNFNEQVGRRFGL